MVILRMENEAFTGLEAAMVLIAFVVVAAVFSYVMLGAGFYSTQKSQQVIQAAIAQTSGNVAVKGGIYGIANNDTTAIEKIRFSIGPAIGGVPVDYSRMSITWSTNNVTPAKLDFTSSVPAAGQWAIIDGNSGPVNDPRVKNNQIITILVCPPHPLFPDEGFTLEILPESGASAGISRTIPVGIMPDNLLY